MVCLYCTSNCSDLVARVRVRVRRVDGWLGRTLQSAISYEVPKPQLYAMSLTITLTNDCHISQGPMS